MLFQTSVTLKNASTVFDQIIKDKAVLDPIEFHCIALKTNEQLDLSHLTHNVV